MAASEVKRSCLWAQLDVRQRRPRPNRRCRDKKGAQRKEGWLFPARRKNAQVPYLTSIAKHFAEARAKAGLPKSLVLYCGRHDFGTVITAKTGNLKAVMKVMGHRDFKTAMRYQHPEVDIVRAALNQSQTASPPPANV